VTRAMMGVGEAGGQMRGFAVAAGGWDEQQATTAPLRLVGSDALETVTLPAPASVVDLSQHRDRGHDVAARAQAVILAW